MVKRFVVSDCGHSIEPEVVVAQALVVYSRFFAFGRPEKVQPLTVWIGTDAPLEMILTRWDNLQNSQQELERLAQTTTSTASSVADFVQRSIGHLIRQERAPDSDQFTCLYQNVNSDSPVQLICDLGCCPKGCCAIEEMAQASLGYGWAIGLLVFFIMLVVFVLGMVGLHLLTRSKSPRPQKFENGMYSATNSQISGPVYYNSRQLFSNKSPYTTSSLYNM